MRIGVQIGATPGPESSFAGLVEYAKRLEQRGFDQLWMAHVLGFDAMSALAIVGHETERIGLGTAIVPTYPRHPMAMAQQALTLQSASGGRFVLGIGTSHQILIEGVLGLSYEKPARHMREYIEVLAPLLRGEPVKFEGEHFRVNGQLRVPDADPVPLIVAALGPVMLRIAGRQSEGTITWMAGSKTLDRYIIPTIRDAAKGAGRAEPRIVAGFPLALTTARDAAREKIAKMLRMYGTLPSYRALLEREGVEGPADVALIGDEAEIEAELRRLREMGVTDFQAVVVDDGEGSAERALDFLAAQRESEPPRS